MHSRDWLELLSDGIFLNYRIKFVFVTTFAIIPSALLLLFAGAKDRRNVSGFIRLIVNVLLLFFLQVFLYELAMVNEGWAYILYFPAQNLSLYCCLLAAPWLIKASSRVKWWWGISWFLTLVLPFGWWSAIGLRLFLNWLEFHV